ncbi:hypothetical protein L1887_11951 [Cichorium endivia]|nr:hypothetical protein L1887_11951 [Cichorium endivia]
MVPPFELPWALFSTQDFNGEKTVKRGLAFALLFSPISCCLAFRGVLGQKLVVFGHDFLGFVSWVSIFVFKIYGVS